MPGAECVSVCLCFVIHLQNTHTAQQSSETTEASNLSKCLCIWMGTHTYGGRAACRMHTHKDIHRHEHNMWMFMYVCGLCKMRMFPWGGGCTDRFQSLEICSPPWTKCSRQSAGCQWQQSLSKALMCFDRSAVKRSLMLWLSVAFCGKSQSRQTSYEDWYPSCRDL